MNIRVQYSFDVCSNEFITLTVDLARDRMTSALNLEKARARSSTAEQWPFKPLVLGSNPSALTQYYGGFTSIFTPAYGGNNLDYTRCFCIVHWFNIYPYYIPTNLEC